jgi:hypothetical protein
VGVPKLFISIDAGIFKKPERYLFSFSAISVTFSVIVEQE